MPFVTYFWGIRRLTRQDLAVVRTRAKRDHSPQTGVGVTPFVDQRPP